ncbi:MAG: hypothetical protein RMK29_15495 [Myxococcales bacterium]|nr:hypothetical protein [Myxococcales bacterium]
MAESTNERRRRGWFRDREEENEAESTAARIDEVLGILATGVRRVLERPPEKVAPAADRAASK